MSLTTRLTEWLLGSRPDSPGQGTSWNFTHDFPWPTWLLLLFLTAAIAFVVLVYRRDAGHLAPWQRSILTLLRLASLAVALFFLSQAMLSVERTGLPYLLVLVDTSASMGTLDRYAKSDEAELARRLAEENRLGPPTRLAQAQGLLLADNARLLRDLAQNHKLRLHSVAESDAVIGPNTVLTGEDIEKLTGPLRELVPAGRESRLGEGLRNSLNALRGSAPTAVILLSDGITTDGEPLATAARFARQNSVPVFPVILGSTDPLLDLELHGVLADDTAFLGEPLAFTFNLTGQGCAGRSVVVTIKNQETGENLATREARVAEDGRPQKLELSF
ncbi:MAG: vWA domain-containing protein, partial [Planctomycetaceae bacterium]